MLNQLFRLLVICAYLLPILLGHGGMHVLLGVEHHCCHSEACVSKVEASCCHHRPCHAIRYAEKSETETSKKKTSAPLIPAEDADCFLCQVMALVQQQTPPLLMQQSTDHVLTLISLVLRHPRSEIMCRYAPRGPPLCI